MNPLEVKIIKAEKRGRRINITIESDLFSDEVFAVTPFYDEGDAKNQLQAIYFNVSIKEQSGKIDAKVQFGEGNSSYCHYTKGHSQLHSDLNTFYLDKKDCAKSWFLKERQEFFTESKIDQILKIWEDDKEFHSELVSIAAKRKKDIKIESLKLAKEKYKKALKKLDEAISDLEIE